MGKDPLCVLRISEFLRLSGNLVQLAVITLSFLLNYTTKLRKSPALWGCFYMYKSLFRANIYIIAIFYVILLFFYYATNKKCHLLVNI